MAPKKKRAIDDESEEEFDDLSVQDLSPTKKKVKNSKSPKPGVFPFTRRSHRSDDQTHLA